MVEGGENMMKNRRVSMWVSPEFRNSCKILAVKCELSAEQVTKELSTDIMELEGKIKSRKFLKSKIW